MQGTATGDIVYNRFVNVYDDGNGGGWDFVGAPAGMTIADFITANGANIQVLGDDYALAQYDNATGQYTRYPTAYRQEALHLRKGMHWQWRQRICPHLQQGCAWYNSSLYWYYRNYISKHQYC